MSTDKTRKINGKMKEILLIGSLGLGLCLAVWLMLSEGKTRVTESVYSSIETKLVALLEEMDGVGDTEVMVCETEEGVLGAVIVCEGANNLTVNLHVREAVATALGIEQNNIKIYLKNKGE